jgi:hypothetical protein
MKLTSLAAATAATFTLSVQFSLPAHCGYLTGKVESKHQLNTTKERSPAQSHGAPKVEDPFSSDDTESGDNPPPKLTASPPVASQERGWPNGEELALPDSEAATPQFEGVAETASQSTDDPDQSAEMQLAWDSWHRRVAEEIFARFNVIAKSAFKFSPPLQCRVNYVVTSTGQIGNVQVEQKSSNMFFNLLVLTVLKSVHGDETLLKFPNGSRRTIVSKQGVFLQNYGREGFRHTVGDAELLRSQ